MSDSLVLVGAAQETAARRYRRRYVALMLSMTLLDAVLHAVFYAFSGRLDIILLHLPAEIVFLFGANIAGALWIYRPIYRFMRGSGPAQAAIELNLQYRNSAFCEIFASPRSMRVVSFNCIPHLDRPDRQDAITHS